MTVGPHTPSNAASRIWMPVVVVAGVAFGLSPWGSPQVALGLGIVLALLGISWRPDLLRSASRGLIQVCVILMGFTIDLHEVARAGLGGAALSAGTIALTFVLGLLLAAAFGVEGKLATLLCSGTAICGGSAVAATGPAIRASDHAISVALASVFILNAVALYAFPPIGTSLKLSQAQFGAWAAVAIHDVSSVVGAAKTYGEAATADATVIKLARVLWIAPVAAVAGWWWRRHDARRSGDPIVRVRWTLLVPWFVGGFVLASVARTLLPGLEPISPQIRQTAKAGMSAALFLIGLNLSIRGIREVGWRALGMAVTLWVVLSVAWLLIVRATIT
ncbi:MAG: putative sulfate exporter family transporter [Phycisphaeraceae bacterium]|nr:putative sulfate exporter family transporter [Phycisphaeraceae bacterium]